MNDPIQVHPSRPVIGRVRVPGDKSMSHRAAILGGLADGTTEVTGFLPSDDCLCTLAAMEALGAGVEVAEGEDLRRPTRMRITGTRMALRAPGGPVDCGNSGTAMRLLAGVLAAQPFSAILTGDASLCSRPMKRIADPLNAMGAKVGGRGEKLTAPIEIEGGALKPLRHELRVASAQVKSAILLAGLFTAGETTVVQPAVTRDHTERMFAHFGIPLAIDGNTITLDGPQVPRARPFDVPGDISSAAFWAVAAAAAPGADLVIEGVGVNPTRVGVLDVLRRMGAEIEVTNRRGDGGEPAADVRVRGGDLQGTVIEGGEIPNVIDEIPVLAVAAALARGETVVRDAGELRVKESDRITEVVTRLRAMGVDVEEQEEGMVIRGGRPLRAARLSSGGDHRLAMAFAVAGLFADGPVEITDTACIATSYPGFDQAMSALSHSR